MKENTLISLTKLFAVDIVNIYKQLIANKKETVLSKQLLRSGTSIGANVHEGNYASSRLDFINKFQIALKECYETEYWLDLLNETDYLPPSDYEKLKNACSKIRKLLTASIMTAKNNNIM